jgi:hypothetical protein
LALVGLVMSNVLAKTTRLLRNSQDRRRAANLASMVFEQYNAYAAAGRDLPTAEVDKAEPQAFFKSPDDLGFSGLSITSRTLCHQEGCLVDVDIYRPGVPVPLYSFSKSYQSIATGASTREMSGL